MPVQYLMASFLLLLLLQAEFKPSIWTDHDLAQQLQSCSLVLGLHPDQATDSIVDFALQFGKPFAVVPCCVFPRWVRSSSAAHCMVMACGYILDSRVVVTIQGALGLPDACSSQLHLILSNALG